jgi:hypothetical protein
MTKRNTQKDAADKSAAQARKLDSSLKDWAKSGAKSPDDFPDVERASAKAQESTGPEHKNR